jgi:hypothetical protein
MAINAGFDGAAHFAAKMYGRSRLSGAAIGFDGIGASRFVAVICAIAQQCRSFAPWIVCR